MTSIKVQNLHFYCYYSEKTIWLNANMTGFELRLWRRGLNWSQERAAEELGVSLRTYKTYEKKSPPQLVILASKALETDARHRTERTIVMNRKRTITTREVCTRSGAASELILTHIATGAHGYEALCVSGSIKEENKSCEILRENEYPVTCTVCLQVWEDVKDFSKNDFEPACGD